MSVRDLNKKKKPVGSPDSAAVLVRPDIDKKSDIDRAINAVRPDGMPDAGLVEEVCMVASARPVTAVGKNKVRVAVL
ncbi:MAG: hypothetical protein K8F91_03620, partial [Candidatus Obscuribacterales bacterium]|nr:hypothetical protein [Candidatus Obscuribacterales bacterium]